MNQETKRFVDRLEVSDLDTLEVGGDNWRSTPFKNYQTIDYPEYDLCARPLAVERFDLIILEQVLEHLLWPYRAVTHLHAMLRPGGWALVTTPFLVKVHAFPNDCSRWTESGLKHLLAEGGFQLGSIETGGWGNREAVVAGLTAVRRYRPWFHSLSNDSSFPLMVWAFAQKSAPASS